MHFTCPASLAVHGCSHSSSEANFHAAQNIKKSNMYMHLFEALERRIWMEFQRAHWFHVGKINKSLNHGIKWKLGLHVAWACWDFLVQLGFRWWNRTDEYQTWVIASPLKSPSSLYQPSGDYAKANTKISEYLLMRVADSSYMKCKHQNVFLVLQKSLRHGGVVVFHVIKKGIHKRWF